MKLFKYYPDNVNSFKSISVRGLWCHHPKKMNDPADSLTFLDRDITFKQSEIFRSYFKNHNNESLKKIFNYSDEQVKNFINLQRKTLLDNFAFCALSETFDDILMWSHYSSSHTGFVVEFDFEESQIDHHFQKVNYIDYLPELEVSKIAEFMCGKDENLKYFFQDFSLKTTDWTKEKEWRIWRSKPCYYHYEGKNIKNVYFGINSAIETKAIVAKLINDLNKDVQFHFMEFNKDPIKLVYKS